MLHKMNTIGSIGSPNLVFLLNQMSFSTIFIILILIILLKQTPQGLKPSSSVIVVIKDVCI